MKNVIAFKILILAAIIWLSSIISQHPIVQFIFDGREKVVMYSNFSTRLIHIDVECKNPKIMLSKDRKDKSYFCYENINIFFFPADFTLMHTLGWRYIPLQET